MNPSLGEEVEESKADRFDKAVRRAHEKQLVGLAFSGGGIRSATFNLGVIQGLARQAIFSLLDPKLHHPGILSHTFGEIVGPVPPLMVETGEASQKGARKLKSIVESVRYEF